MFNDIDEALSELGDFIRDGSLASAAGLAKARRLVDRVGVETHRAFDFEAPFVHQAPTEKAG